MSETKLKALILTAHGTRSMTMYVYIQVKEPCIKNDYKKLKESRGRVAKSIQTRVKDCN